MDELAYYLSLTTIRIGKTSMELVKDAELLASLAVTDISRQVLTSLGYSEHQNSEIIFFSLCLASIVEGDVQEPALDFLLECSFRSHPSHGIPDGRRICFVFVNY